MERKEIKSEFKNLPPTEIIEQKLRDWNGQTIFKSKTSTRDKLKSFKSFKTIIDKTGMPFEIIWKQSKWNDVKEKIKKRTEDEKRKTREYFRKK